MGIATLWIKNLPEQEKSEFEKTLRHSGIVLGRLQEIFKERLKELNDQEVSFGAYESPSWAYKQAHLNGAKHELTRLLKLLDFLDHKE